MKKIRSFKAKGYALDRKARIRGTSFFRAIWDNIVDTHSRSQEKARRVRQIKKGMITDLYEWVEPLPNGEVNKGGL